MNEDSLKAKLKTISKETGKNFNELFKQLIFERLLARLSISPHKETLIFKGGFCLRQYIDIRRETKDIDFLIRLSNTNEQKIASMIKDVSSEKIDDGFQFLDASLVRLDVEYKKYPGFRITIPVLFGKIIDKIQIDIGVGDIVFEDSIEIATLGYKEDPLFGKGSISILAYPAEFIFSEKLQAIIHLKALNSRMKDYFDCYTLIKENALDTEKTKIALEKTFNHRNTKIELLVDYSEQLIKPWSAYTKKVEEAPKELSMVISKINDYLSSKDFISLG